MALLHLVASRRDSFPELRLATLTSIAVLRINFLAPRVIEICGFKFAESAPAHYALFLVEGHINIMAIIHASPSYSL